MATKTTVSVWSLLSCRHLWTRQVDVLRVACSPSDATFAVALGKGATCTSIEQFCVAGEEVTSQGSAAWPQSDPLAGLVFAPVDAQGGGAGLNRPHRAMALGMQASVYVLCLEGDTHTPVRAGSADLTAPMYRTRLEDDDADAETTAARRQFLNLFGFGAESATQGAKGSLPAIAEGSLLLPSEGANLDAMLDGPSHNLPPMPLLTERFLQLTLLKTLGGPPPLNAEQGRADMGRDIPTVAVEDDDEDEDAGAGANGLNGGSATDRGADNGQGGSVAATFRQPKEDYLPSRPHFEYLQETFAKQQIVDAPLMLARTIHLDEVLEEDKATPSGAAKRKVKDVASDAAATPSSTPKMAKPDTASTPAGSSTGKKKRSRRGATPTQAGKAQASTPTQAGKAQASTPTQVGKAPASTNGTPLGNGLGNGSAKHSATKTGKSKGTPKGTPKGKRRGETPS